MVNTDLKSVGPRENDYQLLYFRSDLELNNLILSICHLHILVFYYAKVVEVYDKISNISKVK